MCMKPAFRNSRAWCALERPTPKRPNQRSVRSGASFRRSRASAGGSSPFGFYHPSTRAAHVVDFLSSLHRQRPGNRLILWHVFGPVPQPSGTRRCARDRRTDRAASAAGLCAGTQVGRIHLGTPQVPCAGQLLPSALLPLEPEGVAFAPAQPAPPTLMRAFLQRPELSLSPIVTHSAEPQ